MSASLDWTSVRPAVAVSKTNGYLDLPSFAVTGLAWKGASEVVKQYNFAASRPFVLRNRPTKPSGVNYGLCIRYRVGSLVYRYKLWDDENFILKTAPVYNGEPIKPNFSLEIWSLNGQTEASQDESIRLISSLQSVVTDFSVTPSNYNAASASDAGSLANTNTETVALAADLPDLVLNQNSNGYQDFTDSGFIDPYVFPAGHYILEYQRGAFYWFTQALWTTGIVELYRGAGHTLVNTFLHAGTGVSQVAAEQGQTLLDKSIEFTLAAPSTLSLKLTSGNPWAANVAGAPNPTWRIVPAISLPLSFSDGAAGADNA